MNVLKELRELHSKNNPVKKNPHTAESIYMQADEWEYYQKIEAKKGSDGHGRKKRNFN